MTEGRNAFVEFHALTSHAPGNLNRDELGSPKTAFFGGSQRLRISSQCLKRTWRTSEYFQGTFAEDELGLRTARLPEMVTGKGSHLSSKAAQGLVVLLASIGKTRDTVEETEEGDTATPSESGDGADLGPRRTAHLLFLSNQEVGEVNEFALASVKKLEGLASSGKMDAAKKKLLGSLREGLKAHLEKTCRRNAVDVALFGRFLTSDEFKTVEAAMQVAHALGTQAVRLEYDYFSAVDDLQPREEMGAGHIGETEFAASVFYKYAVCDWRQLRDNLDGDSELGARAMGALARAVARAVPRGKNTGTAPQNPADYLEVLIRRDAPVSLANAFLKPVEPQGDQDVMDVSIARLQAQAERYREAYGCDVVDRFVFSLRDAEVVGPARRCESLAVMSEDVQKIMNGLEIS